MKRIIRLTESDLTRIVRRVIREQDERQNMLGALIEPEEYFMKMKSNRNECMRFQKWVKENYPQTDLGRSGSRRDGVDGDCGRRTTAAFDKYGDEFVMEVINKMGDEDNNDNGAIPKNSIRDCQSLFKRKVDDGSIGGSPYEDLVINGEVEIEYNGTVSPNYRSVTIMKDGKPFCKIPVIGGIGDCRDEMELASDDPGSPMIASLDSPVNINITGTVSPKDRGTIIRDAGGYFCMVPSSIVPESRMRKRRI